MKEATRTPSHSALSAWIRMLKAQNLILRKARSRLSPHCTMPQFDILAQLSREKDGTPLVELSRRLLVTAGNLTGVIDRMERTGLVERRTDQRDRRITRIYITAKGRQLARSILPLHAQDMNDMFASLSEREIRQLRRLLDKLIRGLEHQDSRSI